MKKILWSFVATLAMTVTGITLSDGSNTESRNPDLINISTHVHSQGKHCNGIVGCDCPGFSPILDQEVWKQAYCKRCGHKKTYHR